MSETETIEGGLFYCGYGSRDKTPMTKRQHTKPRYKKCSPNPQTQKSVAFHTLAFYPWHYDRIPRLCHV